MPCVLITGASRGLGHSLARAYLSRGWTVFPLVRDRRLAAEWRERDPQRCHPLVADLSTDACEQAIRQTVCAHTDRLDLLFNNAGIAGDATAIADVTADEVLALLQVHCLGALRTTRAVLPLLCGTPRAWVIDVSSRLASITRNSAGEFDSGGFSYSYRIAKAAQNMLTVCLAREHTADGPYSVALHPGRLQTAMATPDADTPPQVAAGRIADRVAALTPADNGRFFGMDEGEMPW